MISIIIMWLSELKFDTLRFRCNVMIFFQQHIIRLFVFPVMMDQIWHLSYYTKWTKGKLYFSMCLISIILMKEVIVLEIAYYTECVTWGYHVNWISYNFFFNSIQSLFLHQWDKKQTKFCIMYIITNKTYIYNTWWETRR